MPMKRSALLNDDRVARDAKQDCCSRSSLDPVFFWFKRRTVERERERAVEKKKGKRKSKGEARRINQHLLLYFACNKRKEEESS